MDIYELLREANLEGVYGNPDAVAHNQQQVAGCVQRALEDHVYVLSSSVGHALDRISHERKGIDRLFELSFVPGLGMYLLPHQEAGNPSFNGVSVIYLPDAVVQACGPVSAETRVKIVQEHALPTEVVLFPDKPAFRSCDLTPSHRVMNLLYCQDQERVLRYIAEQTIKSTELQL